MTHFPAIPLTPEQRKSLSLDLYSRMEAQVKSYHAHRGRNSTSVPTDIARELMVSMIYTLETAGGYFPGADVSALLGRGQNILENQLEQARQLLKLVSATAPAFQTRYFSDAVLTLGIFLDRYDPIHMAHLGPEELDYPLLVPVPEQLRGIDSALYVIRCLWMENQILDAFAPDVLSALGEAAPPDYWTAPQNLCEQPLWNAMATVLLGRGPEPLMLTDDEWNRLTKILCGADKPQLQRLLRDALSRFCFDSGIPTQPARYAEGAIHQLVPRLDAALTRGNIYVFFW